VRTHKAEGSPRFVGHEAQYDDLSAELLGLDSAPAGERPGQRLSQL